MCLQLVERSVSSEFLGVRSSRDKYKKIIFLMLISITYGVFACDYPKSGSFKTIPLDGAAIVFDFVPIEKELSNTRRSQEIGIDVHFFQVFRWFRGVNWSIALFGQHKER